MSESKNSLSPLRELMEKEKIHWVYVPDCDPHQSEYTAEYFALRKYLSGFRGSNGKLLVGRGEAYLWTDGRYAIQAERELKGTGISIFMEGTTDPGLEAFFRNRLEKGETLALDGRLISAALGHRLEQLARKKEAVFKADFDPAPLVWPDRPPLPARPVFALPESITGKSAAEKLNALADQVRGHKACGYLTCRPDNIMYLLNLRGGDVDCCPVALCYFYLSVEGENRVGHLFIREEELSPELRALLKEQGIRVCPYEGVYPFFEDLRPAAPVMCDLRDINYTLLKSLEAHGDFKYVSDPVRAAKTRKNDAELKQIREYYLLDSVAVTRFMYWVKQCPEGLTEVSAARKMDALRQEIPGFYSLSFPTISAYGPNGAIVHYETREETDRPCPKGGMLLVDSGGQYPGTTTDVTRTYALGEISPEWKKHYTLVLAGCLRLGNAVFPAGTCGFNLDALARSPLWEEGLDYRHGTGHGIGAMLNVHEAPAGIRLRPMKEEGDLPLQPGMILSDEPGVYIEGSHGIRLENICEVTRERVTDSGEFFRLRFLTWAPFDRDAIDPAFLTDTDRRLLNEYHREVFQKLSSHFEGTEIKWLKEITAPL